MNDDEKAAEEYAAKVNPPIPVGPVFSQGVFFGVSPVEIPASVFSDAPNNSKRDFIAGCEYTKQRIWTKAIEDNAPYIYVPELKQIIFGGEKK